MTQGAQSAPDWQPAAGNVVVTTTREGQYVSTPYRPGRLVLDMGYPGGILTLPGYAPPGGFTDRLTVNLLNSGGGVRYDVTVTDGRTNLMNPTGIDLFNPLAGSFSQNSPPLSNQFFNTGREAFAGLDYLYDAAGGDLGLAVGFTTEARDAFASARGQFTAGYYRNDNAPTGVSNLTISGNTISDNGGAGVDQRSGFDRECHPGELHPLEHRRGNPAVPRRERRTGGTDRPHRPDRRRQGACRRHGVRGGRVHGLTVQVFASPGTDAGDIEGRRLLGEINAAAGRVSGEVEADTARAGDLDHPDGHAGGCAPQHLAVLRRGPH